MALNSQRLELVFQSRPDILDGIKRAADSPGRIALFNEIADHVYDRIQTGDEPAHKKRKVEGSVVNTNGDTGAAKSSNTADEAVLLHIKEISVSVPQRKKFELCFTANHLYARAPGTTAPIPAITYAWQDIEYAFYLPVPEKTQVQHNYILFPRGTCLPSKTNPPTTEPLVFTVSSTAPKEGTVGGSEASSAAAVSDTYKDLFHWALDRRLKSVGNEVDIVSANPHKFQSNVRQAHRPNERAVHVGGFRGSKDGFLFFLENGILWGFKKPLLFIPLNRIAAISYTNILQITFNIVVEVFAADGEDANDELEFGMLDQQDYGGIDDYIKTNRLQDRSMAEQRKGKLQLAENKTAKKNGDGAQNGDEDANGDAPDDGLTELERAQRELEHQAQDDEDEDEEDYDPGSEGDSEGSGDSSDDDDDDDDVGDDGNGDRAGDENMEDDGDEEVEAEDDEEEEEDELAAEPEVKSEAKREVKPELQEAPTPAQTVAPAIQGRTGWATIRKPQPVADVDMDEQLEI